MRLLRKQWSAIEVGNERFRPPRSSDLKLWLRSHDLNLADSAQVQNWPDISGNNATATQAVAGKRPLYAGNLWHGYPMVEFDGTDDEMTAAFPADDSKTIFVVGAKASFPGVTYASMLAVGDTAQQITTNDSISSAWLWFDNVSPIDIGGDPTLPTCISIRSLSADVLQCFFNGLHTTTVNPFAAVGTQISIGAAFGTNFGDYSMLEIMAYTRNLSDGEMAKVHNYLSRKYSLGF